MCERIRFINIINNLFCDRVSRKVIDTGGGFLLEEEEFVKTTSQVKVIHLPGQLLKFHKLILLIFINL